MLNPVASSTVLSGVKKPSSADAKRRTRKSCGVSPGNAFCSKANAPDICGAAKDDPTAMVELSENCKLISGTCHAPSAIMHQRAASRQGEDSSCTELTSLPENVGTPLIAAIHPASNDGRRYGNPSSSPACCTLLSFVAAKTTTPDAAKLSSAVR